MEYKYITVKEMAKKFEKEEATVLGWIASNYIKGVYKDDKGEYMIPAEAREPYTASRKPKNVKSLKKSILTATYQMKSVCPELYNLSELDFNNIIDELVKEGKISKTTYNGVDYYNYIEQEKKSKKRRVNVTANIKFVKVEYEVESK